VLFRWRLTSWFVLAGRSIDAALREHQPGDWASIHNVLLHNLVHVRSSNASIPYGIRIDDHGRAVLALIEAAGAVGADAALQPAIGHSLLERLVQGLGAGRIAAAAPFGSAPPR
jgi:hypothetical protein